MTIEALAEELRTPMKDIFDWLKESNTDFYMIRSHEKGAGSRELSSDGEQVVRSLHLEHTHPEHMKHIRDLESVLFDQRKQISKLEYIVELYQKRARPFESKTYWIRDIIDYLTDTTEDPQNDTKVQFEIKPDRTLAMSTFNDELPGQVYTHGFNPAPDQETRKES